MLYAACASRVSRHLYMAASWYKRRHSYIVNLRVKLNLKIILPTIALEKLVIDSDNHRHVRFHSKSGGREIFIIT